VITNPDAWRLGWKFIARKSAARPGSIVSPKMILVQHLPIVGARRAAHALRAAALLETHDVQEGERLVRHLRRKEEECA